MALSKSQRLAVRRTARREGPGLFLAAVEGRNVPSVGPGARWVSILPAGWNGKRLR
jgi:hypothetical protein